MVIRFYTYYKFIIKIKIIIIMNWNTDSANIADKTD